jgi:hypothetical protein
MNGVLDHARTIAEREEMPDPHLRYDVSLAPRDDRINRKRYSRSDIFACSLEDRKIALGCLYPSHRSALCCSSSWSSRAQFEVALSEVGLNSDQLIYRVHQRARPITSRRRSTARGTARATVMNESRAGARRPPFAARGSPAFARSRGRLPLAFLAGDAPEAIVLDPRAANGPPEGGRGG